VVEMDITSVGIFIREDDILFEKRRKNEDNYAGLWALPGGHKRKKETSEKALKREMGEELGIRVIYTKYLGNFRDIDPTSKNLYSHHAFFCVLWEGKIKKTFEQKKVKWIKFRKIKKMIKSKEIRNVDVKILKKLGIIR
jgi:ADP-ribose pyrophosphatase YjhB (NUDIX family)